MGSQPLGFAQLLGGGVLLTAAITGATPRDILSGKHSPIKPLVADFPMGPSIDQPTMAAAVKASGRGGTTSRNGVKTSGKGAVNPVPGWSTGRIDQGVDFSPPKVGAPILAPLDAVVLKTGAPGWPGGGGVLLKLSNGATMYIYEGVDALVHAGQHVQAGQIIARAKATSAAYPSSSIEIGYADSNGVPLSHSGYTEGKITKWGDHMKAFLSELGVHFP